MIHPIVLTGKKRLTLKVELQNQFLKKGQRSQLEQSEIKRLAFGQQIRLKSLKFGPSDESELLFINKEKRIINRQKIR